MRGLGIAHVVCHSVLQTTDSISGEAVEPAGSDAMDLAILNAWATEGLDGGVQRQEEEKDEGKDSAGGMHDWYLSVGIIQGLDFGKEITDYPNHTQGREVK